MGRAPTDTKRKLIETATDLIWRDSYGSVSVDDICKQASVRKGSFYHYFPSKVHLALATMDWCMQEAKVHYDDIFSVSRHPIERLELMAEYIYEQQLERQQQLGHVCGCPFATLGSELAAQDEEVGKKISGICAKKIAYYENTLRDLVACGEIDANTDIALKAEEVFSFVMGQLIMARIKNNLSFIQFNLKKSVLDLIGVKVKNNADDIVLERID